MKFYALIYGIPYEKKAVFMSLNSKLLQKRFDQYVKEQKVSTTFAPMKFWPTTRAIRSIFSKKYSDFEFRLIED